MSIPRDWDDFLDDIAVDVDGLVVEPAVMSVFRERIRPFGQWYEEHCVAEERYTRRRLRYWERVKKHPEWQDKESGPPKKGWEWDKSYLSGLFADEIPARYVPGIMAAVRKRIRANRRELKNFRRASAEHTRLKQGIAVLEQDLTDLRTEYDELGPGEKAHAWIKRPERCRRSDAVRSGQAFLWYGWADVDQEKVFGCWRPPLKEVPEHPCERLRSADGGRLPAPRSREEEYARYCVCLASIHDHRLTGSESITKGVWPDKLAQAVWFRFSGGQPYGPNRAFIEIALKRVKAKLQQLKRTGGEPPASPPAEGLMRDERPRVAGECEAVRDRLNDWLNDSYGEAPPNGCAWRDFRLGIVPEITKGLGDILRVLHWDGQLSAEEDLKGAYMQFEHAVRKQVDARPDESVRSAATRLTGELAQTAEYYRLNAEQQVSEGENDQAEAGPIRKKWPEVQQCAEAYLTKHLHEAPTSKRQFADVLKCHPQTLNKAIENSPLLQEWLRNIEEWRKNKSRTSAGNVAAEAAVISFAENLRPRDDKASHPEEKAELKLLQEKSERELWTELKRAFYRYAERRNSEGSQHGADSDWAACERQLKADDADKEKLAKMIILVRQQISDTYDTDPEAKFHQGRKP